MRRKDREITSLDRIAEILARGEVASVAFGGGAPYVIPMNYGFTFDGERFTLYLHGAAEGEKIARIAEDSRAAFTVYTDNRVYAMNELDYTSAFDSVCGAGTIRLLDTDEDKRAGLAAIMAHYAPGKTFDFPQAQVSATSVMEFTVADIAGKHHD